MRRNQTCGTKTLIISINRVRFVDKLVMNPKSETACFVNAMIGSSGEVALQVLHQHYGRWRLSERFVLDLFGEDTHFPACLTDIKAGINVVTSKRRRFNHDSTLCFVRNSLLCTLHNIIDLSVF